MTSPGSVPISPGFTPDALQFLADLASTTSARGSSHARPSYERLLKEPLEALCAALGRSVPRRMACPLTADPKRSPFRIYRDTRFSKDKSPYKTNVAASFAAWTGSDASATGGGAVATSTSRPARHLHGRRDVAPGARATGRLPARRGRRTRRRAGVPSRRGFASASARSTGSRLKRVPAGYAPTTRDAELLKLKDVTFGRRSPTMTSSAPTCPNHGADLAAATPVLRFLATLPA